VTARSIGTGQVAAAKPGNGAVLDQQEGGPRRRGLGRRPGVRGRVVRDPTFGYRQRPGRGAGKRTATVGWRRFDGVVIIMEPRRRHGGPPGR